MLPEGFDWSRFLNLYIREPWQKECEIIPEYMPPNPRKDTKPRVCIRHKPSGAFLRHSCGPRTGSTWDIYGDDFQTPELAFLELGKAPAPPRNNRELGIVEFNLPLKANS